MKACIEYVIPCWSVLIDIVNTKVLLKTREYGGEPKKNSAFWDHNWFYNILSHIDLFGSCEIYEERHELSRFI